MLLPGPRAGSATRIRRGLHARVARFLFSNPVRFALLLSLCLAPKLATAQSTITLAWDPNSGDDTVGYRLYQGVASRTYTNSVDAGANTSLEVSPLVAGVPYFFAVTAYDSNGVESDFSTEVSYTSPTSPTVTSISSVILLRPTLHIEITSTRQAILSGSGPPGHTYDVMATADLAAWTVLGQAATDNSGAFRFTDPTLANLSSRSYCLRESPAAQTASPLTNAPPTSGDYIGLFHEPNQALPRSSGCLTVSSNARGVYSGQLQIGNRRYSISGHLNLQNQATNVILRANDRPLTIGFALDSDSLSGLVTDGTWTANLSGDRAQPNTSPSPWAGSYTVVIPGSSDDPSLPAGHSVGAARVNAAGRLTFAGTLADGARVTQTIQLSRNGRWPLYLSLYSGNGSLIGWMGFEHAAESDLSGSLFWTELPDPKIRYYPAGFSRSCQALGSSYRPLPGKHVLNLAGADLIVSGGNLSSAITKAVALGSSSPIMSMGSNPLRLSFSLGTGTFKGSATDPLLKKSFPFSGVVFQKQNLGYGLLLGTNQTSQVMLTP